MNLFSPHAPSPRFVSPCRLLVLMLVLFRSTATRAIQVIGGNLTVVEGDTAVLFCKMTDRVERLTQISWRRMTRKVPGDPFFFVITPADGPNFANGPDPRISFIGNLAERDGTLQITNVSLDDEGDYSCIITLFPSGNYKTVIPLHVLVPPSISLNESLLMLGNEDVLLATCTAAGSRPPAQVKWLTGTLGKDLRETTNSTTHANGTSTTVSSLFGIPMRNLTDKVVECAVSSASLSKDQHLPFTMNVFSAPLKVTISERPGNTIEGMSESNPKPSFKWTRSGKIVSNSSEVRVDGGKLTFLRWDAHLTGLYQCQASNRFGEKNHDVFVVVLPESNPAPWVLFGLSLCLNIAAAVWIIYKKRMDNDAYNFGQPVPNQASSLEMASDDDRETPAGSSSPQTAPQ